MEQKGMLSPFTIFTSIITGCFFPALGSLLAAVFLNDIYWTGLILTSIGGFLTHYLLSHTIHDLYHLDIEDRHTTSKQTLKLLLAITIITLFSIALYLTYETGWPVMLFAIIGLVVSLYAEGLLHHESQMAFGAMFLVIGAFYVQMGYFMDVSDVFARGTEWLEAILLSLFAFFSQYGWLLFYRLDDYDWDPKKRNESIIITKIGLIFLVVMFAVHVFLYQ